MAIGFSLSSISFDDKMKYNLLAKVASVRTILSFWVLVHVAARLAIDLASLEITIPDIITTSLNIKELAIDSLRPNVISEWRCI